MKHSHYHKNVEHLKSIDVYRVLSLFGVTDPCVQHATKKLLCAGQRGVKSEAKDIQEAIDTLQRRLEMYVEDAAGLVVDFGQQNQWPADDSRIDVIGQNGNTGEHYICAECGSGIQRHLTTCSKSKWRATP
jgi:hypothetical protein